MIKKQIFYLLYFNNNIENVCVEQKGLLIMLNSIAGIPLIVGGNYVQITPNGKVRITDPNGKTKEISQKSFQKQMIKNADKINNGDYFEFKSGNTAKKAAAGIGIAALVTAGIVYRKNIGKLIEKYAPGLKNFYTKTVKPKAAALYEKLPKCVKEFGTKAKNYYNKVQPKVSEKFTKFRADFNEKINIKNNEDRSINGLYKKYVKGPFVSLINIFKK